MFELKDAPRVGYFRGGSFVDALVVRRGVNGIVVWSPDGDPTGPAPPPDPDPVDPPGTDPDPEAGTTSYPSATTTSNVSTVAGIQTAMNAATTGNHIVLANGTYTGNFSISKSATSGAPIVIRAANLGQATINGTITIGGGQDVWLWGIRFAGYTGGGGIVRVSGTRHKIIGCTFFDWGSSTSFTRTEAIATAGRTDFLEIGYCLIDSPRTFKYWSSTDGQWPQWRFGFRSRHEASAAPYDLRIHHCHYRDFPAKPSPDYRSAQSDAIEIAPIGSNFDTRNRIDRCLFENIPDGSGSVIDAKAGKAGVVEYCTVINCAGRIDLRDCDNWTLRHLWMENSQGIGVMGKNHVLQDIQQTGGARRIMLNIGNLIYTTPPGTDQRRQVSDVIVQCCPTSIIRVGLDWPVSPTFMPRNVTIRGTNGGVTIGSGSTNITQDAGFTCAASQAFKLSSSQVGPNALP